MLNGQELAFVVPGQILLEACWNRSHCEGEQTKELRLLKIVGVKLSSTACWLLHCTSAAKQLKAEQNFFSSQHLDYLYITQQLRGRYDKRSAPHHYLLVQLPPSNRVQWKCTHATVKELTLEMEKWVSNRFESQRMSYFWLLDISLACLFWDIKGITPGMMCG